MWSKCSVAKIISKKIMVTKISIVSLLKILRKNRIDVNITRAEGYNALPILDIRIFRNGKIVNDRLLYDLDEQAVFLNNSKEINDILEKYYENKTRSIDSNSELYQWKQ